MKNNSQSIIACLTLLLSLLPVRASGDWISFLEDSNGDKWWYDSERISKIDQSNEALIWARILFAQPPPNGDKSSKMKLKIRCDLGFLTFMQIWFYNDSKWTYVTSYQLKPSEEKIVPTPDSGFSMLSKIACEGS